MGQQGGWHVRFTPDRVGTAALWFLPAGSTTARERTKQGRVRAMANGLNLEES